MSQLIFGAKKDCEDWETQYDAICDALERAGLPVPQVGRPGNDRWVEADEGAAIEADGEELSRLIQILKPLAELYGPGATEDAQ